ncbi:MAG: hypothetical protein MUC88_00365 [Planctomycetes bacterium]|jgi:hypothetical protein|nr:hypothetical protein [Planctomycetota bacterium]
MINDRISAAELRALGCDISADIPDCASVPRAALVFEECECDFEGEVLRCQIPIRVNAPFEWVEAEFEVNDHGQ